MMSEQGQDQGIRPGESAQHQGLLPGQLAQGSGGGKFNDFINDTPHHTVEPDLAVHSDAVRDFIQSTVVPGFQAARTSLEGNGRAVRIVNAQRNATLLVSAQGQEEFSYTVKAEVTPSGVHPIIETTGAHGGRREQSAHPWSEEWLAGHRLSEITPDAVTQHVLAAYSASTNR